MNRLTYAERGDPRWKVRMPTFLIDGRDLCDWLGLTRQLQYSVAGVGAVPETDPFIYAQPTVWHRVSPGEAQVQTILAIHLGDVVCHFVSAHVRATKRRILWSNFDSLEGVRTPLADCGHFAFARQEYVGVLAQVCRDGLLTAQQYWLPEVVNPRAIDLTWAVDH